MDISIKATGHTLTDGTRDLLDIKFAKLGRLCGREQATLACEIEESIATVRAGAHYRVEGNLTVAGRLYRAEAENATLEGAIDHVRDELVGEVRRDTGRTRRLMKKGGALAKRFLRFGRS